MRIKVFSLIFLLLTAAGLCLSEAQTRSEKEARAIDALEAGLDDALQKHQANINEISKIIEAGLDKKGMKSSNQKSQDSARFIYFRFNEFNMAYMQEVLRSGKKATEEERRRFVYNLSVTNGIAEFFELVESFFTERRQEIRETIKEGE